MKKAGKEIYHLPVFDAGIHIEGRWKILIAGPEGSWRTFVKLECMEKGRKFSMKQDEEDRKGNYPAGGVNLHGEGRENIAV